ncbi:MAG TPA: TrbI/VirB10 family protein [Pseudobdellovibrionaceae bacterium]|nr:TrbI/VirB10 family protein [Pseudobdellovibrionaceae bacterium]
MTLFLIYFIHQSFAAGTGSIEIFNNKDQVDQTQEEIKPPESSNKKAIRIIKKSSRVVLNPSNEESNIPEYFEYHNISETRSKIVLSTETKQERLMSVRSGDIVAIEIKHSIIAFPDEKAPVVGVIKSGTLIGAKLFGNSSLEKNSKRVFIEFERVSFDGSTYELKGSAITDNGTQGFQGEYHTREGEYFAGDFISSFVAAYFDSQIPRSTNAFGQIQEDKSVDSAFKKGLAAGAMSSAERFKEKLKKSPEFSEISGPITAKLLIYEGGQRL